MLGRLHIVRRRRRHSRRTCKRLSKNSKNGSPAPSESALGNKLQRLALQAPHYLLVIEKFVDLILAKVDGGATFIIF